MSHYLISEASRLVDEESHVLRYWEEELALKIPRNDLGHRYYTEVQLEIFRTIKELKRPGFQLKEIKQCLEEMESRREERPEEVEEPKPEEDCSDPGDVLFPEDVPVPVIQASPKMQEFRRLMADIFSDVMNAGANRMTEEITEQVSRRVIKEMNYLDREREEWEEEQFKRLDEAIRNCQRRGKFRAEAAAAETSHRHKRWKRKWKEYE